MFQPELTWLCSLCVHNIKMYIFKPSTYTDVGETMHRFKDNIKMYIFKSSTCTDVG